MSLSAKEVAIKLDTDARTLRKFLREVTDPDDQPGQGGRWIFEAKQVKGLKKQFDEWRSSQATPKKKGKKAKSTAAVEIDDEELEEVELDDDEIEDPDDEDLEELEDDDDEDDDIEEL